MGAILTFCTFYWCFAREIGFGESFCKHNDGYKNDLILQCKSRVHFLAAFTVHPPAWQHYKHVQLRAPYTLPRGRTQFNIHSFSLMIHYCPFWRAVDCCCYCTKIKVGTVPFLEAHFGMFWTRFGPKILGINRPDTPYLVDH